VTDPGGVIGMIGLGRTGLPIAINLIARGHAVRGVRRGAGDELVRAGGDMARTPRELAQASRLILSCLPSVDALDAVMASLLPALGPDHVIVELGSFPLAIKQAYRDQVAARGARFVDGEISGTPAMTAARASVILLAGDPAACEAARAVCRDASDHVRCVGAFGAATRLKLIANLLVAVHTVAAAEAMLVVERGGIDAATAIDVLGLGAGASTMFRARAPRMAARQFTDPAPGPVAMLAAYLAPIEALADEVGAPVPLFSIAAGLMRDALAAGRGAHDIACVIELLAASSKGMPT
jgi:putative dehydrogenase